MGYITSGDTVHMLSRGVLFVLDKKTGIKGYFKWSSEPNIYIPWSDRNAAELLIALVKEHPLLWEILPSQYKSNPKIKSTAILSSIEKEKTNKDSIGKPQDDKV